MDRRMAGEKSGFYGKRSRGQNKCIGFKTFCGSRRSFYFDRMGRNKMGGAAERAESLKDFAA